MYLCRLAFYSPNKLNTFTTVHWLALEPSSQLDGSVVFFQKLDDRVIFNRTIAVFSILFGPRDYQGKRVRLLARCVDSRSKREEMAGTSFYMFRFRFRTEMFSVLSAVFSVG